MWELQQTAKVLVWSLIRVQNTRLKCFLRNFPVFRRNSELEHNITMLHNKITILECYPLLDFTL